MINWEKFLKRNLFHRERLVNLYEWLKKYSYVSMWKFVHLFTQQIFFACLFYSLESANFEVNSINKAYFLPRTHIWVREKDWYIQYSWLCHIRVVSVWWWQRWWEILVLGGQGRLSGEIKYKMDIEKCIGFHLWEEGK